MSSDFMSHGYDLIQEPLNLREAGQNWFAEIYNRSVRGAASGLLLGATPWLAHLLRSTHRRLSVVDGSSTMLDRLSEQLLQSDARRVSGEVRLIHGSWLALPSLPETLDTVVGDNSLSYLTFPDGWTAMCEQLAERMSPGGKLITRCLSASPSHSCSTPQEIVDRSLLGDSINFTAVRATLLFAHWDKRTYAIPTERVADTFALHRAEFDRLFRRFPVSDENDLLTVKKYVGANAVYYAPPIDDILRIIARRFDVTAVHFGPYPLSNHFPMLVAVRR